jgi:hypothetical protein
MLIMEGFDKDQEKALRNRKRRDPELDEIGKWKEMYRYLFPSEDKSMMPSPCKRSLAAS